MARAESQRNRKDGNLEITKDMVIDPLTLKKLGDWVRNSSGLEAVDGACFSRRVEFFKGDELVDCLTSETFRKKKILKVPSDGYSREQAMMVAEQMLQIGFFHRAISTNAEMKQPEEMHVLEPVPAPTFFEADDDDYFIWTLEQSNTRVLMQSGLFLIGAIFIAAIKAWPIWLKIFVWWCSLVMLICLSALIVLRLVVFALMTLVGFRGMWLLPNMFSDDLDFLDCFEPLMGKGFTMREAQAKVKAALKPKASKKEVTKKTSKPGDAQGEDADDDEAPKVPGRFEEWNFGLMNLAIIIIFGILLCNYTGLFMPDNIPDFVVNKNDLFAQFPSLAPPNETLANATIIDETTTPVEGEEVGEDAGEYKEYTQSEEEEEEEAFEMD